MSSDVAAMDRATGRGVDVAREGGPRKRDGSPLERVTVNLVARASAALQRLSDRTGDSRTDIINRAILVYDFTNEITSRGGAIYVRESKSSELQLVKVL